MSATSLSQPSASDLRELTMDVHLRDARELFMVGEFDPFDASAPTQSGVEQIKAAAQNMRMPQKITLALYLPAGKVERSSLDSIHAALARYCAYREREAQAAIDALKREAIIELRVGGIVLAIVVVLALILALIFAPALAAQNPVANVLSALVSGALVIALWVVAWAPIETFFVEPLPLVWERRFFERLAGAEVALHSEDV